MADSIDTTQTDSQAPEFDDGLPEGGHALEVAARAGFGPLSPLAHEAWHGQAVPCVSCGQLVRRADSACEHCGQDLSEDMVRKMRQHAGPWFVLEHVRPFPGVSLERVIRQIRRDLITETSIVRGPSNDYQWRFAVETPGLCRYFGKCWCCHGPATLADAYCPHCLHYLSFDKPRAAMHVPGTPETRPGAEGVATPTSTAISAQQVVQAVSAGSPMRSSPSQIDNRKSQVANPQVGNRQSATAPQSPDLARLSAAVRQVRVTHVDSHGDVAPSVGGVKVAWIAALLIVGAIVTLLLISRARSDRPAALTAPSLPTMPAPVSPPRPAPTSVTTTPAATSQPAPATTANPPPVSPNTQPAQPPSPNPAPPPANP